MEQGTHDALVGLAQRDETVMASIIVQALDSSRAGLDPRDSKVHLERSVKAWENRRLEALEAIKASSKQQGVELHRAENMRRRGRVLAHWTHMVSKRFLTPQQRHQRRLMQAVLEDAPPAEPVHVSLPIDVDPVELCDGDLGVSTSVYLPEPILMEVRGEAQRLSCTVSAVIRARLRRFLLLLGLDSSVEALSRRCLELRLQVATFVADHGRIEASVRRLRRQRKALWMRLQDILGHVAKAHRALTPRERLVCQALGVDPRGDLALDSVVLAD